MPLIAPDVVRYSFIGSLLGRPCVNVLDMVVQNQGVDPSRADAIGAAGESLIDNFANLIVPIFSTAYSFQSLAWIDLDSADGETGSRTTTGATTLPVSGPTTGDPYSSAIALLVTKDTHAPRGKRNGRWFLGGLTEGQVQGNLLDATTFAGIQDNFSDFVEGITETSPVVDFNYFPTVVHTHNAGTPSNPDIEYVSNTQVVSFTPQLQVSTQRRRNRP